jgi:cytochrome b subunit of formate dehydrogenase
MNKMDKWHVHALKIVLVVLFYSILPAVSAYPASEYDDSCMVCHRTEKPVVDREILGQSPHRNLACLDCHAGAEDHYLEGFRPAPVRCATCHEKASADYAQSIHARAVEEGRQGAAGCVDCHGAHDILPSKDPRSRVNHFNLAKTCGRCHDGSRPAADGRPTSENIYRDYRDSIHGRAVTQSGLVVAPDCSGCHGAHTIRAVENPASPVHRSNIPDTCGGCHAGIVNTYRESIHGKRFAAGLYTAPVCTDCHSAHEIRRIGMAAWQLDVVRECGNCHAESLRTFRGSYHGKVTSLGFTRVARCSDCHGAHDIQPGRDPQSKINSANLVQTCGRCHAGATAGFVRYDPHADPDDRGRNPLLYYVKWFMIFLLSGVFAFFGLHTLLWGMRAQIARWSGEIPRIRPSGAASYYVRFTAGQRILHGILIVSFLGIAMTGMPLLYSESAWAARLARALGGFGAMGIYHRIFAVILTILFFYHLIQIFYWVAVRKDWGVLWGPNSLVPRPRDIADLVRNFLWFFGLGPKPTFGRFTYWEKFDYFAVFWGMPVIGITGYILWFNEFIARFIPGWWFNVAQVIHSEEALLATAFIFTIHYFNADLRPEKFPMDLVMFTGSVSEAELREERAEEFKQLEEEGRLASIATEAPPIGLKLFSWIFGGAAIVIGLVLLVLILMAVFF